MLKTNRLTILLLLLALCFGCGQNVQVKGKVTYPDGEPVTRGRVAFVTDKEFYSGQLKSDGTYTLGTLKANDGIPPGKYKVYIGDSTETISAPASSQTNKNSRRSMPPPSVKKEHVAQKYCSSESSDLSCEVKGSTVFDFTVDRP